MFDPAMFDVTTPPANNPDKKPYRTRGEILDAMIELAIATAPEEDKVVFTVPKKCTAVTVSVSKLLGLVGDCGEKTEERKLATAVCELCDRINAQITAFLSEYDR